MLSEIAEFDCRVLISGFRATSTNSTELLRSAQSELEDTAIQFLDLDRTAGHRHVLLATYDALKAQATNQMISRSLAMEILLYISGSRQISEALDRVGVRGDTEKIVVVAVTKSREEAERINDYLAKSNLKTDDALLDEWTPSRKSTLRKVFGLTEKELQAASRGSAEPVEKTIQRLMIERSAVLAVKK